MSDLREAPHDLWAVSVGCQSGGAGASASWGDRHFFENEARMHDFVLDALLDIDAEDERSTTRSTSRRWLRRRREVEDLEPRRARVSDLLGVWHLVDGAWCAVEMTLANPGLVAAESTSKEPHD